MQAMKEEINKLQNTDNKKKPYQTPQILSTETLEALAGLCIGGKGNTAFCPSGPLQS